MKTLNIVLILMFCFCVNTQAQTYTVEVNYQIPVDQMISTFNVLNSDVLDLKIQTQDKKILTMKFFVPASEMMTKDILAILDCDDLRPAEFYEMLAFLHYYKNTKLQIVALGSSWVNSDGMFAPIQKDGNLWGWNCELATPEYAFLVVQK